MARNATSLPDTAAESVDNCFAAREFQDDYRDGYDYGLRLAGDMIPLTRGAYMSEHDFDRGVRQALEDVFMDRDEEDL